MDDWFDRDLFTIAWLTLMAMLIASSWPRRRTRPFVLSLFIAAPRETVWSAYHTDLEDPISTAFHKTTVAMRRVSDDPPIDEFAFDASGHGSHFSTVQYQRIEERHPELSIARNCSINGKPYPYGREQLETLRLEEQADGTLATYEFHGETGTFWQFLALRRGVRQYFEKVQHFCETGRLPPRRSALGSLGISLGISLLAVGSFALWLGWISALVLAVVLVLHEFGHWLAMRMTGQPAPRVLLVPFFGGVAVANHPHKSLFDDAFCSLMGPGFSAVLAAGFLVLAVHFGALVDGAAPLRDGLWGLSYLGLTKLAIACAFVLGLLNLFQLLPVLPLDGGHVLRAVIQSFSHSWARWVLLAVTLATGLAFAVTGFPILASIMAVGALQAWHMGSERPKGRPMGRVEIAMVLTGFGLFLAAHGAAVYYGAVLIGWNPF